MRQCLVSAIAAGLLAAGLIQIARADDCADPSMNNPAFSTTYLQAAKPCPPDALKPRPVPPARSAGDTAPKNAAQPKTADTHPKPVVDPDHAVVTKAGTGTLMTFGNTTVCVSGSLSVDISGGTGRRPMIGHDPSETACQ